jgi:hypothetical protein
VFAKSIPSAVFSPVEDPNWVKSATRSAAGFAIVVPLIVAFVKLTSTTTDSTVTVDASAISGPGATTKIETSVTQEVMMTAKFRSVPGLRIKINISD